MPYIKQGLREQLQRPLEDLMIAVMKLTDEDGKQIIADEGVYNYIISTILGHAYEMRIAPSYSKVNTVVGILESAKIEFYHRLARPYEEQKLDQNGDVY